MAVLFFFFLSRQTPIPRLGGENDRVPRGGTGLEQLSFLAYFVWNNPPTCLVFQVVSKFGSSEAFTAGSWVCKSQIPYGAETRAAKCTAPVLVMQFKGCDLKGGAFSSFLTGHRSVVQIKGCK